MTFTDSVKTCFTKYAEFGGVAARSEFWWWALFCVVGTLVCDVISYKLGLAFTLATFIPYLAVTSRRLHDTDRSGWWQLIGFIPVIGTIVLIVWLAQDGRSSSRFGA